MRGPGIGGENSANRRTALALATIALGFFLAIMLKYWLAQ
jgi:hypothetical protein